MNTLRDKLDVREWAKQLLHKWDLPPGRRGKPSWKLCLKKQHPNPALVPRLLSRPLRLRHRGRSLSERPRFLDQSDLRTSRRIHPLIGDASSVLLGMPYSADCSTHAQSSCPTLLGFSYFIRRSSKSSTMTGITRTED